MVVKVLPVISIKLNRKKFKQWAHKIYHTLIARDLWDYLDGLAIIRSRKRYSSYAKWHLFGQLAQLKLDKV